MTQTLHGGENLIPVSLLSGFLGAGKTTLLKHVLETKHSEDDFKCAVIVNDMAALNIDKKLIDQSALVQSDKVIAMQNGCFCCTLQNDLVEQIIELAERKIFNYILIEASGVSEPSQIAPLFDLCEEEHNHLEEHKTGPQLGELARLDTCITVIDAAEFNNNLESFEKVEEDTLAELMVEQVEYSNVVILNKTDLVSEKQVEDIEEIIATLNHNAKLLKSIESKIDVMEIVDTKLYSRAAMNENSMIAAAAKIEKADPDEIIEECCKKSLEEEGKQCCKRIIKEGYFIDSGLSQITVGNVDNKGDRIKTRHEKRFGIRSFTYRSRRPFHPGRLDKIFMNEFFMTQFSHEETGTSFEKQQTDAVQKQKKRTKALGDLLRSKGFVWIATSQYFMGAWQQAGNILRIDPARPWLCEIRERWEGTPSEPEILKSLRQENGEDWPFGDRCQEIVMIGKNLIYSDIQRLLDTCLLQDHEMEMGPKAWQESWYDSDDRIRLPTKLYVDENVMKVLFPKSEPISEFESISAVNIDEENEYVEERKVDFHSVSINTVTVQAAEG